MLGREGFQKVLGLLMTARFDGGFMMGRALTVLAMAAA